MRKFLTFITAILITGSLFGGGIVTNTNQSAVWVRLPVRNASIGIDAVYYNPAGLMKLENGFHVSLSNQTIFQSREVDNSYAGPSSAFGLNNHVYKGSVSAPVFPGIYAVYKMDKFAFSFGFNPIGGGGSATYKKGLPSFEMDASDLVPSLAASQGASAYRLDAYFKGTSIFLGYQGGVSYKINDWLSVAVGIRYVTAKNTYSGHLNDIEVNLTDPDPSLELSTGWNRADDIMSSISSFASTTATNIQNAIDADLIQGSDPISPTIAAGLIELGVDPTGFTNTIAVGAFGQAAVKYGAIATLLGDQTADVSQSGSGITPILNVNISPTKNLNIGIKYEFATKLDLKNKTKKDFLTGFTALGVPITMFPNGKMTRNDMPATLAVGVDYKLSSSLKLALGSNYFFDKTADYGHTHQADSETPPAHIKNSDIIANNGFDIEGGLEYNISDKLLVSGGYIWANKGVNKKYQSDITHMLGSQTFGAGGAYSINDKVQINLGVSYTIYKKDTETVDHIFTPTETDIQSRESYSRNAFIIGAGVDFRF
jgi:long-chain fatty acid transport protein